MEVSEGDISEDVQVLTIGPARGSATSVTLPNSTVSFDDQQPVSELKVAGSSDPQSQTRSKSKASIALNNAMVEPRTKRPSLKRKTSETFQVVNTDNSKFIFSIIMHESPKEAECLSTGSGAIPNGGSDGKRSIFEAISQFFR